MSNRCRGPRSMAARFCIASLTLWGVLAPFPSPAEQVFPRGKMFRAEGLGAPVITGWDYDVNGDGRADWRKEDRDGDGVVDVYRIDRDFNGTYDTVVDREAVREKTRRHLVLCIDSIPQALMRELWREGHFRDFYPPAGMISSFPSDTNPAFREIANTEKTPGVEDRYYDRERNRIVGGAWDHVVRRDRRTDRSFHALFDYEQHPRYGALIYLAPYTVADHDLKRCRAVFWDLYRRRQPDEPIFLYVGSTDAIGHRKGGEGMRRQLLGLEQIVDEILYRTEGKVKISIFSDHGNNLVNSDTMIALGPHLAERGFKLTDRLRGERDVVVPRFGLVGDACIYTRPENCEPLAEALRALEGVDFTVYSEGEEVHVVGARGRAKISTRGELYRYEIVEGDPLALGGILETLREEGCVDGEGFAADRDWFRATQGHVYPDIVRRLVAAVKNQVVNRPDLILSLEDGYCYGSAFFVRAIELLGTHGSASASQTNGMAMSTDGPLPEFIRNSELFETLGEPQLRQAAGPTSVPVSAIPPAPPEPAASVAETPALTPTASPPPTPTVWMSPTPSMSPLPSPTFTPPPPAPTATVTAVPPQPSSTSTPTPSVAGAEAGPGKGGVPAPSRIMPRRRPRPGWRARRGGGAGQPAPAVPAPPGSEERSPVE